MIKGLSGNAIIQRDVVTDQRIGNNILYENFISTAPSDRESVGKCPRCGGAVTENKKDFCCSDKTCGFAIWKENRFFTAKKKTVTKAIVTQHLKSGKVSLTGFCPSCLSRRT